VIAVLCFTFTNAFVEQLSEKETEKVKREKKRKEKENRRKVDRTMSLLMRKENETNAVRVCTQTNQLITIECERERLVTMNLRVLMYMGDLTNALMFTWIVWIARIRFH
jgi:hypothetical protein